MTVFMAMAGHGMDLLGVLEACQPKYPVTSSFDTTERKSYLLNLGETGTQGTSCDPVRSGRRSTCYHSFVTHPLAAKKKGDGHHKPERTVASHRSSWAHPPGNSPFQQRDARSVTRPIPWLRDLSRP